MSYIMIRAEEGDAPLEKDYGTKPIVFLGGNCRGRDWRVEFLHRFESEDVVFINPRRESFLEKADIALFWLGEGLANQAARVEMGFAMGADKYVIIGAEQGFLGLEHMSAFSGLVLSTSTNGLMDRLSAVLREVRNNKQAALAG